MERRIVLASGIEVEWRPVPSYALMKIARRVKLPKPTMIVDTSLGEQEVPLSEGTPEWDAYFDELTEKQDLEMELQMGAVLDYGIMRWRKKPSTAFHRLLATLGVGYQWRDQPPDNWRVPQALVNVGVEPGENRRLDYILLALLADTYDFTTMLATLRQTTDDLTPEEVESAEDTFLDGVEGDGASEADGDRGEGQDGVHGDGGGEELGDEPEGMV